MRKIIETLSTLILWAVWTIGSGFAISEFLSSSVAHKKITHHLWVVSWSPGIAFTIFAVMMLVIRYSKDEKTKKRVVSEHTVRWSAEELTLAQNEKLIDLHFASPGLDCRVAIRNEIDLVSYNEQRTRHVTLAPTNAEPVVGILQKAF